MVLVGGGGGVPCPVFWTWICWCEAGEAEKFSVPFPHSIDLAPHTSALHEDGCSSLFPSFLLFCTTSEITDTSGCCSSLVSPRPASGRVCTSYSKYTAVCGGLPHARCKAGETLTHTSNGPCASCPWSGHNSPPLQLERGEPARSGS